MPDDDQVDDCPVDFSWFVTNVDLEFVKVDGNHLYIDLSLVRWLTGQLDRLDDSLLPLLLR